MSTKTALERIYALGRLKQGKKNKTEEAYGKHLELLKKAGEVLWYEFEGINLRLADNTFYKPDYAVQLANRELEIHEVKGFMTEDAAVKIKVAAEKFHIFRFVLVRKRTKKEGGGFSLTEI